MQINFEKEKDLTTLTSFHTPAKASLFTTYSSIEELKQISYSEEYIENEIFCLGEGCNVLFRHNFNGLVIQSKIKGIRRYDKDADTSFLIAGAGEKWSDIVDFAINEGLAGIENLAGIPGSVGAAPVQNIGAYGCEV